MRFEGFAGNEAAKRQLAADIDAGRFPHALVLEGPQGSGRRTLARLLAKAAVCQGAGDKPCGVCPGCVKAAAGDLQSPADIFPHRIFVNSFTRFVQNAEPAVFHRRGTASLLFLSIFCYTERGENPAGDAGS